MRKKLRRGAILALVLVLLSNTIGAQASTTDQAPTVTVSSYYELSNALGKAEGGDVIGVNGTIIVPNPDSLDKGVILKRMHRDARIIFRDDYGNGGTSVVKDIMFDGNGRDVGGTSPFIVVSGNVEFNYCEFEDCIDEGGNGGAVYVGSGDATFNYCKFISNSAYYGSHLYSGSSGVLQLNNCEFADGWADEAGGAIYLSGSCFTYIRNSRITSNHTRIGGGIYNDGYLNLDNTAVYLNEVTVHGADIASEGTLEDSTTEAQYNKWLKNEGLYYVGWVGDLNTSIGGAGEYLKLEVTDKDPNVPDPEPSEPDDGGNTGGEEGKDPEEPDPNPEEPTDPTTPPEEDKEPEETPPAEEQDPNPSIPDEEENGGGSVNIDNSNNSTTDNSSSITDNSSNTTDNSQNSSNSSTDNSVSDNSSSSTVDNSSVVSNTDNSSNRSESSRTENSNNSTATYNYYQTKEEAGATQTASQPISVNVTVPQEKQAETAPQEPVQAKPDNTQNISIDAEGVDLKYEVIDGVVSISIKQHTATASPIEEPKVIEAVNTSTIIPEAPQEADNSPNWVEYVTMILLAVLVLGELGDKYKSLKNKG